MNALGRHILAEFYGCNASILNDVKKWKTLWSNAALEAGAEVREVAF
ncbi:S-adenosylmethionine decarboxylase, partial [Thermosinus carboxydivorans]